MMILEDLDDDRQAEAGSFGARRHVRLDQLVTSSLGKPLPLSLTLIAQDPSSTLSATTILPFSRRAERVDALAGVLQYVGERLRNSRRSKSAMTGSGGRSSSKANSGRPTRMRNSAWRTQSERSSLAGRAFGMRAKEENSSTMRLMSSTWRMIVSVH